MNNLNSAKIFLEIISKNHLSLVKKYIKDYPQKKIIRRY